MLFVTCDFTHISQIQHVDVCFWAREGDSFGLILELKIALPWGIFEDEGPRLFKTPKQCKQALNRRWNLFPTLLYSLSEGQKLQHCIVAPRYYLTSPSQMRSLDFGFRIFSKTEIRILFRILMDFVNWDLDFVSDFRGFRKLRFGFYFGFSWILKTESGFVCQNWNPAPKQYGMTDDRVFGSILDYIVRWHPMKAS